MAETWSRRLRLLLVISLAVNLFLSAPSPWAPSPAMGSA